MLYSDIKKRLPELCKELVLMIPKDIEYSYHEDYEGNVSVKIVKDEDRINLEINDIKFSIGPSYFAERYYLNCEKYEEAFSRNPEPIILLSKLFTNLACESDEEFNKIIGEGDQESDKDMIRFQIMKIAKGIFMDGLLIPLISKKKLKRQKKQNIMLDNVKKMKILSGKKWLQLE